MQATTPPEITEEIRRFCATIGEAQQPRYVYVEPQPDCAVSECFANVQYQVIQNGGSREYGWIIWDHSSLMLEAECHAVWKKPDDTLLDPTPQVDGEMQLLFLADSTQAFDFETQPPARNQRVSLVGSDSDFEEYLKWADFYESIRSRYPVYAEPPMVEVAEALLRKSEYLKRFYINHGLPMEEPILDLEAEVRSIRVMRSKEYDPYRICVCGSGKKYKFCCRDEDRATG